MTALEVKDLTLSSPILRCEILSKSIIIMTGMEEVFIPERLLRRTQACLVLPELDRDTDTVSMGKAELTILTVLLAYTTKLESWLTACCLACTLSHCRARGVRALCMVIDKMRSPLQMDGVCLSSVGQAWSRLWGSPRKRASYLYILYFGRGRKQFSTTD
jgi:hypothetical protein